MAKPAAEAMTQTDPAAKRNWPSRSARPLHDPGLPASSLIPPTLAAARSDAGPAIGGHAGGGLEERVSVGGPACAKERRKGGGGSAD